jgi:hypothetical protein
MMRRPSSLRRGRPALVVGIAMALACAAAGCGPGDQVSDAQQTRRALAAIDGLHQDGFTLGRADAPWTLSVISSPTSYELDQLLTLLPGLSDRWLRTGRVRVQIRTPTKAPYAANGDERAVAGALLAAGLQGRYWNALVRFVANYSGTVTTPLLRDLLRQSGVPDIARAMRDRSDAQIRGALNRADVVARDAHGTGHVIYVLSSAGGAEVDLSRQADKGRLSEMIGRELARKG